MGGAVAGALVGVALFALDLLVGGGGFMGMHDPRVIAEVIERARAHAIGQQLLGLAVLTAAGALFGSLGALLGRRKWLLGAIAALVGHSLMLMRSMAQFPQLYSAQFYERGGARRAFMLLVTDHVAPHAVEVVLVVCLGVCVWRQRKLRTFALALLLVMVGTLLLSQHHRHPRRPSRPNLLLIAVDSLRADRAYDRRFPAITAIADRGVRFRQAFVTQARTFPSFVSLLTGRFPKHHGIRHEFPSAAARQAIGPSLPAILQQAGWRTAVVSDFSGEIFSRTPLGFSDVAVPRLDLFNIVGEQILNGHPNVLPYASTSWGRRLFPSMGITAELEDPMALAEAAAARLDGDGPFFVTVFFTAPHTPYASPEWRKFADPEYRGPFRYLKQPLPALAALPPQEAAQVQALYDGAVASVDQAIAFLLRRLEDNGLRDDTIVVLLGDHGENLFDLPGRGMGHGDHLWGDLANQIPLVIADGKHAPRDVGGIVRDVDLAPTLAALLGVSLPGDGVDLAPLLSGGSLELDAYEESGLWLLTSGPGYRREDRLPYPDLWHSTEADASGDIFLQPRWEQPSTEAKYRALRTPQWKLVYQPTPTGTHWRLFDVRADPEQRADVAVEHPEVVAALKPRLFDWINDLPATANSSPK